MNTQEMLNKMLGTRSLDTKQVTKDMCSKDKKKAKATKATKSSKNIGINDTIGALGFLGGRGNMFAGMNTNVKVGDKAFVTGESVQMKGHAAPAEFAQLSDGSKVTLRGPNKGLIVR
jgi:hypothetical protein